MPSLDNRDIKKLVKEGNVAIEDITVMAKDAIVESFEKAMTRGQELFGTHAFRKSIPGDRRAPINKSLFETWGVLLSKLSDDEFKKLCSNKQLLLNEYADYLDTNNFVIAISRDSMNKWSVNHRYTIVSGLINKYK